MNTSARLIRLIVAAGLSALVLSLAGCSLLPAPQTDPTRYYVLTAGSLPEAETAEKAAESGLVLGLKRIEIVPYLNGKDMVVREGGNEIAYQSFARWAEPLTTSISRALTATLVHSEKVGRVYPQPFPFDVERDYDVSVRVLRCEGDRRSDGRTGARFSALVEVTEAKAGGTVVLRKEFIAPEGEWNGKDFGKLASALSESINALGTDLAAALPAK